MSAPGEPIPRSDRSMHLDPSNPPTSFTHDAWMDTKDALFAMAGVEKMLAKNMNIAQHYYSELMNTVGNKGRNMAEIAAMHFDGSGSGGGGGAQHVQLNDRLSAMDSILSSSSFPGRQFNSHILKQLRTLQRVGNKASHPSGVAPTDRPTLAHAMFAVAMAFRPAAAAPGATGGGGAAVGSPEQELQDYFDALNIASHHRTAIVKIGYTSLSDFDGVTAEELRQDGVTRPIAKKVVDHLGTSATLVAGQVARRGAAAAAAATVHATAAADAAAVVTPAKHLFHSIPTSGHYKLSEGGAVATKIGRHLGTCVTWKGVVADGGSCGPMVNGTKTYFEFEVVRNDIYGMFGVQWGWWFGVCRPGIDLNDGKKFYDKDDTWMIGQSEWDYAWPPNDKFWALQCNTCEGNFVEHSIKRDLGAGDRVGMLLDLDNGGTLTMYLDNKPCGTIAEGLAGPLLPCIASFYQGKVVKIHSGLPLPQ